MVATAVGSEAPAVSPGGALAWWLLGWRRRRWRGQESPRGRVVQILARQAPTHFSREGSSRHTNSRVCRRRNRVVGVSPQEGREACPNVGLVSTCSWWQAYLLAMHLLTRDAPHCGAEGGSGGIGGGGESGGTGGIGGVGGGVGGAGGEGGELGGGGVEGGGGDNGGAGEPDAQTSARLIIRFLPGSLTVR
eukprot:7380554-Prymnesium_polylepis.1